MAVITLATLRDYWKYVSDWVNGTDVVSSPKVTVSAALPAGTNNIGDVDITTIPPLVAGTAIIGKVGIDQTTDGTTNRVVSKISQVVGENTVVLGTGTANIGDVDVITLPSLPAGTNNIGDVDVLTLPSLPAGANVIGTVNSQALSGTVLNVVSAAITVTTTSADLSVDKYKELSIDVNISAVAGTSPTYTLSINRKGVDGVYYPIYAGTPQTTAGKITLSLGVGAETNKSFGNVIQIIETLGGTTPSFTRSISIIGK